MSWHFQVVRNKHGYLALHEVYLDAEGKVYAWTAEPERIMSYENLDDLRQTLRYMLRDAIKHPVIDVADLPTEKDES